MVPEGAGDAADVAARVVSDRLMAAVAEMAPMAVMEALGPTAAMAASLSPMTLALCPTSPRSIFRPRAARRQSTESRLLVHSGDAPASLTIVTDARGAHAVDGE